MKKHIIAAFLISTLVLTSCNEEPAPVEKTTSESLEKKREEKTKTSPETNETEKINDKKEKRFFTTDDKELLEKSYEDLSVTERGLISDWETKTDEMNEEELDFFKTNLTRLKDEKALSELNYGTGKQLLDEENGKIYKFDPGYYGMENNISIPEAGSFDFAFEGQGNFYLYDKEGDIYYEEYIDAQKGIPKIRGFLFDGWSFKTDDNLTTYIQLDKNILGGTDFDLYRGRWAGGRDLEPGSYRITYFDEDIIDEDFSIKIRRVSEEGDYTEETLITKDDNEISAVVGEGDSVIINGISKIHLHPEEE